MGRTMGPTATVSHDKGQRQRPVESTSVPVRAGHEKGDVMGTGVSVTAGTEADSGQADTCGFLALARRMGRRLRLIQSGSI